MTVQGYQVRVPPDEWSITHTPAVATQASASKAAVSGIRHYCRSISAIISAVAAQAGIHVVLRDGASGAGTILWSQTIALPVGGIAVIQLDNLNIPGSPNTAMTLEPDAAPAGTNFASVSLTGYDEP
jgi:hypothetical protein